MKIWEPAEWWVSRQLVDRLFRRLFKIAKSNGENPWTSERRSIVNLRKQIDDERAKQTVQNGLFPMGRLLEALLGRHQR